MPSAASDDGHFVRGFVGPQGDLGVQGTLVKVSCRIQCLAGQGPAEVYG
jgi:hypothetical protein